MSFLNDLKILYHLALRPVRGRDHAERMESFYSGQAEGTMIFENDCCKGGKKYMRKSEPIARVFGSILEAERARTWNSLVQPYRTSIKFMSSTWQPLCSRSSRSEVNRVAGKTLKQSQLMRQHGPRQTDPLMSLLSRIR